MNCTDGPWTANSISVNILNCGKGKHTCHFSPTAFPEGYQFKLIN